MDRIAACSCLLLAVCWLAGRAGAEPIELEDLIGELKVPAVEGFEDLVGIDFPGGLDDEGYGAPFTGFQFPSGLVLRMPSPNGEDGFRVGDFDVAPTDYDLGSNGPFDDLCDVLPRFFPLECGLGGLFDLGGTAFAATGSDDLGEILFEFPVAVRAFGLFVSTRDQSPLTMRSYDAFGALIEELVIEDSDPAPLRDENFRGLDSPPDRPINFFSLEGGGYVFDEVLFEKTTGCTATPRENCLTSVLGGSKLKIKAGKLSWKLRNGEATVPTDLSRLRKDVGVALCIYDETEGVPSLVAAAHIPPDPDLWTATSKGFKYKNKEGLPDGVTKVKLKLGESGVRISVKIKSKDIDLPETPLNQDPAVRIQGVALGISCFENTFVAPAKKNDAKIFKAVEN